MLLPAQQSGDNAAEGVAYCGGDHAYAQDFQSLQDRGLADQPTLDGRTDGPFPGSGVLNVHRP